MLAPQARITANGLEFRRPNGALVVPSTCRYNLRLGDFLVVPTLAAVAPSFSQVVLDALLRSLAFCLDFEDLMTTPYLTPRQLLGTDIECPMLTFVVPLTESPPPGVALCVSFESLVGGPEHRL